MIDSYKQYSDNECKSFENNNLQKLVYSMMVGIYIILSPDIAVSKINKICDSKRNCIDICDNVSDKKNTVACIEREIHNKDTQIDKLLFRYKDCIHGKIEQYKDNDINDHSFYLRGLLDYRKYMEYAMKEKCTLEMIDEMDKDFASILYNSCMYQYKNMVYKELENSYNDKCISGNNL